MGALTITIVARRGLVTNRSARPPKNMNTLRRAMDTEEPITVCSSVVSVVIRDCISVGWFSSKNAGCMRTRRAYTASRMSALTRSPTQETK